MICRNSFLDRVKRIYMVHPVRYAYHHDFLPDHWRFIEKLVNETNALVIAPGYRLTPFATYKEAFDLIVSLYKKHCAEHPDKKIILMGDSAGGGFSLALLCRVLRP